MGHNDNLSYSTQTSCQKGSYLHINIPIIVYTYELVMSAIGSLWFPWDVNYDPTQSETENLLWPD